MIQIESKKDDEMILKFTNGDIERFEQAMNLYDFVDAQALFRFAISILLVAQDKDIQIKQNSSYISVVPAEHSVKKGDTDGK